MFYPQFRLFCDFKMKIKFQNLGSIKEAELDLRPLTVIIGPNNSNKTYIAYSIYGLWKRIYDSPTSTFFRHRQQKELPSVKLNNHQNGIFSLEIDENFCNLLSKYIQGITTEFSGKMLDFFFQDSSQKIFEKAKFQINLSKEEVQNNINKKKINLSNHPLNNSPHIFTFLPSIGSVSKLEDCQIFFELHNKNVSNINLYDNHDSTVFYSISVEFVDFSLDLITSNVFSSVFAMPAERNAFINTYKMLANRRYKILKETQRGLLTRRNLTTERQLELLQEQGDINYPQPVEDFLDFLTDLEFNSPDIDPKNKNEFQQLADQIEEHIQNKNKTEFKNTKFGGKEIKISVKKGLEIDLYNASSSIKQLAPLLLYLRYRAKVGDFLVIDEPEMNLHPESQVKLLEALSILVNLGVRVLLTTHSPYIMAHLNNIVNGNHDDQEILENQAQSLYLQDSQAFLKMDQVSAYEIKENKLFSLHDPDYGIRWDTLSDVSVDVQQKFFAIYEAGQKNSETNETEEEENFEFH